MVPTRTFRKNGLRFHERVAVECTIFGALGAVDSFDGVTTASSGTRLFEWEVLNWNNFGESVELIRASVQIWGELFKGVEAVLMGKELGTIK